MTNVIQHKSDQDQQFNVQIIGKHLEATNSIREYLLEKLHKFEKIVVDPIDVHVRLEVNKNKTEQECFVRMQFSHFHVTVHAVTTDLYASIDKAFHRIGSKVRKWKNKIQNHHTKSPVIQDVDIHVFGKEANELADEEEVVDMNNDTLEHEFVIPEIVKRKTRPLKTLTVDEALMKLDLSGDHFLVFQSEEEKALKVLYKRRDGTYGMMTPQA